MSEWKPGDVALVTDVTGDVRPMVHVGHDPSNRCWHGVESNGDLRCLLAGQEQGVRPLLVIDPQDHGDLWRAFQSRREQGIAPRRALYDAITALAYPPPPKPPEPMGLGAVVEDSEGVLWTRVEAGEVQTRNPWYPNDPDFQPDEWANLPSPTVLSEGVQR